MKAKTISPLKDNPLRNPGQSVQEEIDKIFDEKVTMLIIAPALCIYASAMTWWYKHTNKIPNPAQETQEKDSHNFIPNILCTLPNSRRIAQASIRRNLERQGNIIGANDLWLAAHALALDLTLVTNNTREFSRIDGLKIENWV